MSQLLTYRMHTALLVALTMLMLVEPSPEAPEIHGSWYHIEQTEGSGS